MLAIDPGLRDLVIPAQAGIHYDFAPNLKPNIQIAPIRITSFNEINLPGTFPVL